MYNVYTPIVKGTYTTYNWIVGTSANNTLSAYSNDLLNTGYYQFMFGHDGNDLMTGSAGRETMWGGFGKDTLFGGAGNDILYGDDIDSVDAYKLFGSSSLPNSNYYQYEEGSQATADYYHLSTDAFFNLNGGAAYADVLHGGEGNDYLAGGWGHDTLYGDAGNDTLVGHAYYAATPVGNSEFWSNDNKNNLDTLIGGSGDDTYIVNTNEVYLPVVAKTSLGYDIYTRDVARMPIPIAFDAIQEDFNGGTDTVLSEVSYDLTNVANVENLTLAQADRATFFYYTNSGDMSGYWKYETTPDMNGTGNSLNNVITGNSANNILNGGSGGNDTLIGGAGNDRYIAGQLIGYSADNPLAMVTTDHILEAVTAGGIDTLQLGISSWAYRYDISGGYTHYNDLKFTRTGDSLQIDSQGYADADPWGSVSSMAYDNYERVIIDHYFQNTSTRVENVQFGDGVTSTMSSLLSSYGYDYQGSTGNDTMNGVGGLLPVPGMRAMHGGDGNDRLNGNTTSALYGDAGNDVLLGGTVNNDLHGGTGNDYLRGGAGNDTLDGELGNDILQGGTGSDTFTNYWWGSSATGIMDGGADNDTLWDNDNSSLLVGGKGNDNIHAGYYESGYYGATGRDIIAFNSGDGQDDVYAGDGAKLTLSLGGGMQYGTASSLTLSHVGQDLILKSGTDSINFRGWYNSLANHSVLNLQIIAESVVGFNTTGSDALRNDSVEQFNFSGLFAEFDAQATQTDWELTDARLNAHLAAGSSDIAAFGGDLAYQYGKTGTLAGIGLNAAQSVINNVAFGSATQGLNSASTWSTESVKLVA